MNELGWRLEKGEKDLLMHAGSLLAAVGAGQEELSIHQHGLESMLCLSRLKAMLGFTEWGFWKPAGLELQWHTPSCGRKGQIPAQTSAASCFLCSLVCLAYSVVFGEHPSLGCTTCAFLSSFCLCSAWICSVCLPNSKTSPCFNLFLSVFGLYLNSGL